MYSKIFLEHPQSVNETYLQHAHFAGGFAVRLFLASLAAAVHALIPGLFEKTASRMIESMYAKTHNRGG